MRGARNVRSLCQFYLIVNDAISKRRAISSLHIIFMMITLSDLDFVSIKLKEAKILHLYLNKIKCCETCFFFPFFFKQSNSRTIERKKKLREILLSQPNKSGSLLPHCCDAYHGEHDSQIKLEYNDESRRNTEF